MQNTKVEPIAVTFIEALIGAVEVIKEHYKDDWQPSHLELFKQDLRDRAAAEGRHVGRVGFETLEDILRQLDVLSAEGDA